MEQALLTMTALALAMSLSACGGNEAAENNIVAADVNAMSNQEVLPSNEQATNAAAETTAEEPEPEPAKPAPAKPKPAEPKAAEPKAPASDCLPEHRAAGHC